MGMMVCRVTVVMHGNKFLADCVCMVLSETDIDFARMI